jgi:hypothetical protein
MGGQGVVSSRAQNIRPELPTLLFGPGIGALVNGNHELGRLLQEVE